MADHNGPKAATVVHTVKRANHPRVSAAQIQPIDRQLPRKLLSAVSDADQKQVAIDRILATLDETLESTQLHYLDRDATESLRVPNDENLLQQLPLGTARQLHQWAQQTCESGSTAVHGLSGAHQWTVVTVPVMLRGRPPEVLLAVFRSGQADIETVAGTLQLGSSHITLWGVLREANEAKVESRHSFALLELLAKLDNSDDLTTACYLLVNELSDYLGCGRVALGLVRSSQADCRLVAVSKLSDFDRRSEFAERLESVLNEALIRNKTTVIGSGAAADDEGTLTHQSLLASSNYNTLISAPLHNGQDDVVAAWLFLDQKPECETGETLQFVRASQAVVGSRLWMLRRAQLHPLMRPVRALIDFTASRRLMACALVMMLVVAAMAIPMNYKIGCECQLEPVSRRFVAAPYDGTLNQALVEPGQIVSAGQVLARMDARELRWELSGLEADYQSEQKKRDAASARDEVALAQQSDLEMQRLKLKIQLIRHRLDNLEVKSPIDGVVIAGDLKKSEGAPLSIGQAMFEIGPLDEMIVEVAIPEREILHVRQGMVFQVRLDAAQHKAESGTIARISPRSEIRDGQSVYIAEGTWDNPDQSLRPGMKGSAKVVSDPHPLGWNLLHKAWESFAMMVGC